MNKHYFKSLSWDGLWFSIGKAYDYDIEYTDRKFSVKLKLRYRNLEFNRELS